LVRVISVRVIAVRVIAVVLGPTSTRENSSRASVSTRSMPRSGMSGHFANVIVGCGVPSLTDPILSGQVVAAFPAADLEKFVTRFRKMGI